MKGGRGLGQDIRQSLQGIGKEMLGDVIKQSVSDLVIAITGQTIATNAQTIATYALEAAEYVAALFGFADGGRPTPGVPYVVGEHGPELRVDDGPGTIIPNHRKGSYLASLSDGAGSAVHTRINFPSTEDYMTAGGSAVSPRDGDSFSGNHTFHIYESSNAAETARQVAIRLKNASPRFSKFAS